MPRISQPRALAALVAVAILATALPLRTADAQMDPPAWKRTVAFAQWMQRTPAGVLLVSSRAGIEGVDPATGQTRWINAALAGLSKESLDPISADVALINVAQKDAPALRALDLRDGKERWSVTGLSLGHWVVPSKNALLVWLWRPGDKLTPRELGGKMTLLSLEDGKVLWEDAAFFANWAPERDERGTLWPNQRPVFDTDSTMIEFMSGAGVRRWHLGTGKRIWAAELKLRGASAPTFGYAPMLLDREAQRLYVPSGLGLASINVADGAITWRPRLRGIPRQLEIVSGGLLMRTGSETVGRELSGGSGGQRMLAAASGGGPVAISGQDLLVLLDPATGQPRWKEIRLGSSHTNFVLRDGKAYYWAADRLFAVNLADGTEQVLGKLPGFKGEDSPQELVATETGLIIRGAANVMFVGFDGKVVHHTSYKQPKRSIFVRAAAGAMNVAAGNAAQNEDLLAMMILSGGVSVGDPDELRKRTAQTVHTATRSVMYAEVKREKREDNGFVLIDAMTGKTIGDVITEGLLNAAAFAEKNVDLGFDADGGWMFYLLMSGNTRELGGWRMGPAK